MITFLIFRDYFPPKVEFLAAIELCLEAAGAFWLVITFVF